VLTDSLIGGPLADSVGEDLVGGLDPRNGRYPADPLESTALALVRDRAVSTNCGFNSHRLSPESATSGL